jgi:hypothetical protein
MKKLILITLIGFAGCTHTKKPMRGIVLSHAVTSDQYDNVTYRTVIKCTDGEVIERVGLKFYAVKVNDTVSLVIDEYEIK